MIFGYVLNKVSWLYGQQAGDNTLQKVLDTINGDVYKRQEFVEEHLIQPVFIMDHPVEISPLTKRKPDKQMCIRDRTEYIIRKVKEESGLAELKGVATGGLGRAIADETDSIDIYDSSLTLDGLRIIYDKNRR